MQANILHTTLARGHVVRDRSVLGVIGNIKLLYENALWWWTVRHRWSNCAKSWARRNAVIRKRYWHRVLTWALVRWVKAKSEAIKSRDRATEKNMKGTAAKGLYADHLRRARLLRREGQAESCTGSWATLQSWWLWMYRVQMFIQSIGVLMTSTLSSTSPIASYVSI